MPERYGASAEKAQRAKVMLREGRMSQREVAKAVGTSQRQVWNFAQELKEEQAECDYRGEATEPRWRPSMNAYERVVQERDDLARINAQIVADSMVLVEELRALRGRIGDVAA